jgi:hypothetical protein
MTKAIARASLSIVALVGMSACGENSSSQASNPSGAETETPDSAPTSPDSAPTPAEDVRGVTLSGQAFSLNEALQEKPVVLWFWAPG